MPFYSFKAEDGEEIEEFFFKGKNKNVIFLNEKEYKVIGSIPSKERIIGIYKILNKKNGKVYIGQSKNLNKRALNYTCKKSHVKELNEDIEVLGIENFSITILERCEEYELNDKETKYIREYKSRSTGYNKLSLANTGPKPPGFGEKIRLTVANRPPKSVETLKRMSELFSGENNPFFGKKHSQETLERIKKTKIKNGVDFSGEKNPSAKSIVCIDTGEVFKYASLASEKYSLDLSSIIKCCKGKRNHVSNMRFKYL